MSTKREGFIFKGMLEKYLVIIILKGAIVKLLVYKCILANNPLYQCRIEFTLQPDTATDRLRFTIDGCRVQPQNYFLANAKRHQTIFSPLDI